MTFLSFTRHRICHKPYTHRDNLVGNLNQKSYVHDSPFVNDAMNTEEGTLHQNRVCLDHCHFDKGPQTCSSIDGVSLGKMNDCKH